MLRIRAHNASLLALILFAFLAILPARAAENLVQNGDFARGADARGWPRQWECAGDPSVRQTLSLDHDPQRGPCARLACAAITPGQPGSHAMILQPKTVAIKSGQWYRISFQARQEGIRGGVISVGVSNTKTWAETGLRDSVRVTRQWQAFAVQARAKADAPAAQTRLQIWWTSSPGTLWLSDVRVEEVPAPQETRAPLLETRGRRNLVPNGSFECGVAGWGSLTERLPGWGNLNALVGEVDAQSGAPCGRASLRIALSEKTTPVFFFDYFNLTRQPIKMPLAGNLGWIPVEPGAQYTLSAWMKADRPGVPAAMAVWFGDRFITKPLTLSTAWRRYAFTVKASDPHAFVAAGPDLRQQQNPDATVWLDGVQFERGAQPTPFQPADPVEVEVATESDSCVFAEGQPVALLARAANATSAPQSAKLSIRLEDFFDAPAGAREATLDLAPGAAATARIPLPLSKKGFYRARIRAEAAGRVRETALRLAVLTPFAGADSPFGMNHAHPWDSQLRLMRQAGICWTRDWSLKWQFVEPEQGRFTFAEPDAQINRPLALGQRMDLMLPFPSANWSSSAPASVKASSAYPENLERIACMPRDLKDFAAFAAACVGHYKDKAKTWEILNEPIYTHYSLPEKRGYTAADYARLLQAAHAAIKQADPQSFIVGGIASHGARLGLYEQFIKAGGLDSLDALNVHVYPGLEAPEHAEAWLSRLNGMMRAAGKPRPLWMTEIGYYADDEPSSSKQFSMATLESEKLCASYLVRYDVIMLANNVQKIFYHAGGSSRLNDESYEGIFLRYGDAPRKMLTAQSALANALGGAPKFVEKLKAPDGVWSYLFETRDGALLVAWAEEGMSGKLTLNDARLHATDIQGNPLSGKTFNLTEYPIYIHAPAQGSAQLKGAIRF